MYTTVTLSVNATDTAATSTTPVTITTTTTGTTPTITTTTTTQTTSIAACNSSTESRLPNGTCVSTAIAIVRMWMFSLRYLIKVEFSL